MDVIVVVASVMNVLLHMSCVVAKTLVLLGGYSYPNSQQ